MSDRSVPAAPFPAREQDELLPHCNAVGYFFAFHDKLPLASFERRFVDMGEKLPSKKKQEAAAMQSLADRTGQNKEIARQMQSEADQSDIRKHGQ
jgi:hypothetical protein